MGTSFRPSLADIRGLGDYATLFRWNLFIPNVPQVFVGNSDPVAWNILCESTDLPSKTVDKIMIGLRGHKHYQPGIVTPTSQITLNFLENVSNEVHKLFLGWQEAIWEAGTGRSYETYKLAVENLQIERLDNEDRRICVYTLINVFLESYTMPRLDGTTSGPFSASVVLSYDDFFTNLGDGTQYGDPGNMLISS